MKGIKLCAECANYDLKKHKCKMGASREDNPRDKFYDDCPLPDVVAVVRCKDCVKYFRDTPYCVEHNKGYCHLDGMIKSENHYCGYAERDE